MISMRSEVENGGNPDVPVDTGDVSKQSVDFVDKHFHNKRPASNDLASNGQDNMSDLNKLEALNYLRGVCQGKVNDDVIGIVLSENDWKVNDAANKLLQLTLMDQNLPDNYSSPNVFKQNQLKVDIRKSRLPSQSGESGELKQLSPRTPHILPELIQYGQATTAESFQASSMTALNTFGGTSSEMNYFRTSSYPFSLIDHAVEGQEVHGVGLTPVTSGPVEGSLFISPAHGLSTIIENQRIESLSPGSQCDGRGVSPGYSHNCGPSLVQEQVLSPSGMAAAFPQGVLALSTPPGKCSEGKSLSHTMPPKPRGSRKKTLSLNPEEREALENLIEDVIIGGIAGDESSNSSDSEEDGEKNCSPTTMLTPNKDATLNKEGLPKIYPAQLKVAVKHMRNLPPRFMRRLENAQKKIDAAEKIEAERMQEETVRHERIARVKEHDKMRVREDQKRENKKKIRNLLDDLDQYTDEQSFVISKDDHHSAHSDKNHLNANEVCDQRSPQDIISLLQESSQPVHVGLSKAQMSHNSPAKGMHPGQYMQRNMNFHGQANAVQALSCEELEREFLGGMADYSGGNMNMQNYIDPHQLAMISNNMTIPSNNPGAYPMSIQTNMNLANVIDQKTFLSADAPEFVPFNVLPMQQKHMQSLNAQNFQQGGFHGQHRGQNSPKYNRSPHMNSPNVYGQQFQPKDSLPMVTMDMLRNNSSSGLYHQAQMGRLSPQVVSTSIGRLSPQVMPVTSVNGSMMQQHISTSSNDQHRDHNHPIMSIGGGKMPTFMVPKIPTNIPPPSSNPQHAGIGVLPINPYQMPYSFQAGFPPPQGFPPYHSLIPPGLIPWTDPSADQHGPRPNMPAHPLMGIPLKASPQTSRKWGNHTHVGLRQQSPRHGFVHNRSSPNDVKSLNSENAKKMLLQLLSEGKRVMVIIRGCPGSGKTTLAKEMCFDGAILSTDNYFVNAAGVYEYDYGKLSEAHMWNQYQTKQALEAGTNPIIIDNTNSQSWEIKPYAAMAVSYGYHIEIVEPDTPWRYNAKELAKRNHHGVNIEGIRRMIDRYEHNITLQSITGMKRTEANLKENTPQNPSEKENGKKLIRKRKKKRRKRHRHRSKKDGKDTNDDLIKHSSDESSDEEVSAKYKVPLKMLGKRFSLSSNETTTSPRETTPEVMDKTEEPWECPYSDVNKASARPEWKNIDPVHDEDSCIERTDASSQINIEDNSTNICDHNVNSVKNKMATGNVGDGALQINSCAQTSESQQCDSLNLNLTDMTGDTNDNTCVPSDDSVPDEICDKFELTLVDINTANKDCCPSVSSSANRLDTLTAETNSSKKTLDNSKHVLNCNDPVVNDVVNSDNPLRINATCSIVHDVAQLTETTSSIVVNNIHIEDYSHAAECISLADESNHPEFILQESAPELSSDVLVAESNATFVKTEVCKMLEKHIIEGVIRPEFDRLLSRSVVGTTVGNCCNRVSSDNEANDDTLTDLQTALDDVEFDHPCMEQDSDSDLDIEYGLEKCHKVGQTTRQRNTSGGLDSIGDLDFDDVYVTEREILCDELPDMPECNCRRHEHSFYNPSDGQTRTIVGMETAGHSCLTSRKSNPCDKMVNFKEIRSTLEAGVTDTIILDWDMGTILSCSDSVGEMLAPHPKSKRERRVKKTDKWVYGEETVSIWDTNNLPYADQSDSSAASSPVKLKHDPKLFLYQSTVMNGNHKPDVTTGGQHEHATENGGGTQEVAGEDSNVTQEMAGGGPSEQTSHTNVTQEMAGQGSNVTQEMAGGGPSEQTSLTSVTQEMAGEGSNVTQEMAGGGPSVQTSLTSVIQEMAGGGPSGQTSLTSVTQEMAGGGPSEQTSHTNVTQEMAGEGSNVAQEMAGGDPSEQTSHTSSNYDSDGNAENSSAKATYFVESPEEGNWVENIVNSNDKTSGIVKSRDQVQNAGIETVRDTNPVKNVCNSDELPNSVGISCEEVPVENAITESTDAVNSVNNLNEGATGLMFDADDFSEKSAPDENLDGFTEKRIASVANVDRSCEENPDSDGNTDNSSKNTPDDDAEMENLSVENADQVENDKGSDAERNVDKLSKEISHLEETPPTVGHIGGLNIDNDQTNSVSSNRLQPNNHEVQSPSEFENLNFESLDPMNVLKSNPSADFVNANVCSVSSSLLQAADLEIQFSNAEQRTVTCENLGPDETQEIAPTNSGDQRKSAVNVSTARIEDSSITASHDIARQMEPVINVNSDINSHAPKPGILPPDVRQKLISQNWSFTLPQASQLPVPSQKRPAPPTMCAMSTQVDARDLVFVHKLAQSDLEAVLVMDDFNIQAILTVGIGSTNLGSTSEGEEAGPVKFGVLSDLAGAEIPTKAVLDQSSQTDAGEDVMGEEELQEKVANLQMCFSDVSVDNIRHILEQCNGDMEWASNLLLDGGITTTTQTLEESSTSNTALTTQERLGDSHWPQLSKTSPKKKAKSDRNSARGMPRSSKSADLSDPSETVWVKSEHSIVDDDHQNNNTARQPEEYSEALVEPNTPGSNGPSDDDIVIDYTTGQGEVEKISCGYIPPESEIDKTIVKRTDLKPSKPTEKCILVEEELRLPPPVSRRLPESKSSRSPVLMDELRIPEESDTVCLQLSPQMAQQLIQMFGPVRSPFAPVTLSADEMRVTLDRETARRIHERWGHSLTQRLAGEHPNSNQNNNLDEDYLLAKRLQDEEYHSIKTTKSAGTSTPSPMLKKRTKNKNYQNSGSSTPSLESPARENPVESPARRKIKNGEIVVTVNQIPSTKLTTQQRCAPAPSMREIMDTEQALANSHQDFLRSLEDVYNNEETLSNKLKWQQLTEKFPGVDQTVLHDIYQTTGYSIEDTICNIETSLSQQEPVKNVMTREAAQKFEQQMFDQAVEESLQMWPDQDDLPSREDLYQTLEDPMYSDFRAEANMHYKLRQECFDKAATAYNAGQKDVALYYSQQGHLHTDKLKEGNRRAAEKIISFKNHEMDKSNSIDLHGLHVDEALHVLENLIVQRETELREHPDKRRSHLMVVTGRGAHSRGGVAKLRPAVLEFLRKNNYSWSQQNASTLKVNLKYRDSKSAEPYNVI